MTGKKFMSMVCGGLMVLTLMGGALPDGAEAASRQHQQTAQYRYQAHDEYNRAIRRELQRHEVKVQEIRDKYRSRAAMRRLEKAMKEERQRHTTEMRRIRERFRNATRDHQSSFRSYR